MYYRAKNAAVNNGRVYHVAAVLKRNGRVVRIGTNTDKTHPKFKRQYPDGTWGSHMHAEMDVLRFAKPGDDLEVMRFRKCDHSLTMAKPCRYCLKEIIKAGISGVKYTDWNGEWKNLSL